MAIGSAFELCLWLVGFLCAFLDGGSVRFLGGYIREAIMKNILGSEGWKSSYLILISHPPRKKVRTYRIVLENYLYST